MRRGDRVQDLVVIGASPAGLSLAVRASRSGIHDLTVVDDRPIPDGVVGRIRSQFRLVETVDRVVVEHERVIVETSQGEFLSRVCVIDATGQPETCDIPFAVPRALVDRVHTSWEFPAAGADVLVIGLGEPVTTACDQLVAAGARHVVVSVTGDYEAMSLVSRQLIERLAASGRLTVLRRTQLGAIWENDGFPMVGFCDGGVPDLVFDHIAFIRPGRRQEIGFAIQNGGSRIFLIADSDVLDGHGPRLSVSNAWPEVARMHFPHVSVTPAIPTSDLEIDTVRELEMKHYNATITDFLPVHEELWRIRVTPDEGRLNYQAGQYCSLGLGYWEPRADGVIEPDYQSKQQKLVRRSYSISSPVVDEGGQLADNERADELELYIVLVRADDDNVPGLTPRLALKHLGDRVHLGSKVAGRYTVRPIDDPESTVVFCATGTGEAPHNPMIVELLRRGHSGPILSAVSVRNWSDLGYLDEHRRLEARHANYRYLPMPTREPDVPKRYLQDLLADGELEAALGSEIDPHTSHVFLCGNPEMIGPPRWSDGEPVFPDAVGMAELLYRRGFKLDRRGQGGNLHYEEYW